MSEPGSTNLMLINNWVSVKVAVIHSGYKVQYLRRLPRDARLPGLVDWII